MSIVNVQRRTALRDLNKSIGSTTCIKAGSHCAVGSSASRFGQILSFLLPLIQEGQLSVTGESMCTKYWLSA